MAAEPPVEGGEAEQSGLAAEPAAQGIWQDIFPLWRRQAAQAAALQQAKWLACAVLGAGMVYLSASAQERAGGQAEAARDVLHCAVMGPPWAVVAVQVAWALCPYMAQAARFAARQVAHWWRGNAAP
ncbi:hypothetical protein ABPG75_010428 [Micractinium tetrahymenae]